MKRKLRYFAMFLCLSYPQTSQALFGAGDIVYDPVQTLESVTAFAEQAEILWTQIEKLEKQIEQQIQTVENQRRNLKKLDFSTLSGMKDSMAELQKIVQEAEGLSYEIDAYSEDFSNIYPEYNGGYNGTADQREKYETWNQQTRAGVQDAFAAHNLVNNLTDDSLRLDQLISASNSAEGNLQAMQAANEISGMLVKQLMQLQTMQATDSRAMLSYVSQQASKEDAQNNSHAHNVGGLVDANGKAIYTPRQGLSRLPRLH
ncbi:MAG: P-type conjugative transfer protein TrbJ [Proteobacteria bacterium]|nr:P-type conjugative transfer protein TrbJ [Pseudomonadota bacterium]